MIETRAPRGIAVIRNGGVTSPQGFVAGGVSAGIKTAVSALDVGILAADRPCAAAAMFTRSTVRACAVTVSEEHIRGGTAQAIIVNSGCSNVATGTRGLADAREMVARAAHKLAIRERDVLVGSTGVIGRRLPMERIRAGIDRLQPGDAGGHDFARANMTTDTFPKEAAVRFRANGRPYVLGGCAKGSGMIHPDMGTMFAFLTTDAPADQEWLESTLRAVTDRTFNMVDVDMDTSTSDTLLLFATGAAARRGAPRIARGDDQRLDTFRAALFEVMRELAQAIVKDGEGATKFVSVTVKGAESKQAARTIAKSIANSPLVKTAIAGEDPNWGRIVAAVGKAGEAADRDKLGIWFGDIEVARDGARAPSYREELGAAYMRRQEIGITVDVGVGRHAATVWTCDLTKDYVAINADYRS